MSEWRLPKLKEDKNILVQAKYASSNIDSIAGILTCLSMEARRNELGSMAFVLTELADELGLSAEKVDNLVRWAERQKERQDEESKKD